MVNIGKKKGWKPCPALSAEIGQDIACLMGYHSTPWDGQSLIYEHDLQADGRLTAEMEPDMIYFRFCPECGRALQRPGDPKPVGPPNEQVNKDGRVREKG